MNKYYSTTILLLSYLYKKIVSMISYFKSLLLYHLIKKKPKYLKYSLLKQEQSSE